MGAGPAGATGPPGPRGPQGERGADGSVDWIGLTEAQRKEVIVRLNTLYGSQLKGPKGDKGTPGVSDPKEVVAELKIDDDFMTKLGEQFMTHQDTINRGVLNSIAKSDDLRGKVTSNITTDPAFISRVGDILSSTPKYADKIRGADGRALDPVTMNRTYAPVSVWCGDGEMCRVPGSGKDRANYGIDFGIGDGIARDPNAGRIVYGGSIGPTGLNIFGKGTDAPQPGKPGNRLVNLYDNVNVGGNMSIREQNVLNFGTGIAGKDDKAGRIGYRVKSEDLDIFGAGLAGTPLGVRVWDNLTVENNLSARNSINLVNSTTGNTISGMLPDGTVWGKNLRSDESIQVGKGVFLTGKGIIQTGTDVPEREVNAGQIGYTVKSPDALDIFGAGNTAVSRKVKVWDHLQIPGSVMVEPTGVIQLGFSVPGRETNAGQIGYTRLSTDAVDIVGAGSKAGSRKVKVWDNLTVPGNIISDTRIGAGVKDNSGVLTWNAFIDANGDMSMENAVIRQTIKLGTWSIQETDDGDLQFVKDKTNVTIKSKTGEIVKGVKT